LSRLLYCIFGQIEGQGTGLKKSVHEHTQAYSPSQAKMNVAKKLQRELKQQVYTGSCEVELYSKIHPEKI